MNHVDGTFSISSTASVTWRRATLSFCDIIFMGCISVSSCPNRLCSSSQEAVHSRCVATHQRAGDVPEPLPPLLMARCMLVNLYVSCDT
jgi:hypothetical protein